jgi:hypothetical protein
MSQSRRFAFMLNSITEIDPRPTEDRIKTINAMSGLRARLEHINITPSAEGGRFDKWLEQEDVREFLKENAREHDIVVYASLQHTFIHAVLVPNSLLHPVDADDLLKWSANPTETWNIWSTQDDIGLSPPLDHPGSKTLKGGEQLIFTRFFEGRISRKSYVEVLQKFAHIFDIHYVPEQDAYCRLDEHGDVVELVKVTSIPEKRESRAGRFVTIDRKLLDEYMVLTDSSLVQLFDFTRVNFEEFVGWSDDREETRIANGDLYGRLTIDPGNGSYFRGFQIIRSRSTVQSIVNRIWESEGERQYASFIAVDWKNKVVKEISCDPKCLGNYFTKSDLPFEVSPTFFKAEVLSKYKSDPEKYTVRERSISCRGAWELQTYDINEAGQVHTYLIYLSRLPYKEQLYWKSFNEEPRAPISKRAFKSDFEGEFWDQYEPLSSLKHRLHQIDKRKVAWWTLRSGDLMERVHYPATPSPDEWADEILALDQLLVEGFEEKWLRQRAVMLGRAPEQQWRSLKLLEQCLVGLGFEEGHAARIVAPLREVHDLRSKLKGHATDNARRELRSKAISEYGSYRAHFTSLCGKCDSSFEQIVEAFRELGTAK